MAGVIGDPPLATASKFVVVIVRRMHLAVGADIDRTLEFHLNDVFGPATEHALLQFKLTNDSVVELAVDLGDYNSVRRYSPGCHSQANAVTGAGIERSTRLPCTSATSMRRFP
jgi:hypothetical protein